LSSADLARHRLSVLLSCGADADNSAYGGSWGIGARTVGGAISRLIHGTFTQEYRILAARNFAKSRKNVGKLSAVTAS
jgi:hypothetical protein